MSALSYSSDLAYWPLLRSLPESFLGDLKKFYIHKKSALLVTRFGELYVLGPNGLHLELGQNPKTVGTAIEIEELRGVEIAEIELGSHHTMILATNGDLYGWGRNQHGQLGLGHRESQSRPVLVMKNVDSVRCGSLHTAVIDLEGSAWAWGFNRYGQIGRDDWDDALVPTRIEGIEGRVLQLECGVYNCVALTTDHGAIYHWGKFYPVCYYYAKRIVLPADLEITSIASGQINFLLLASDGSVHCGYYPLKSPTFTLKQIPIEEPIHTVITRPCTDLVCFVSRSGSVHTSSGGGTYDIGRKLTECSVPEVFAQYSRFAFTPLLTTLLPSATLPTVMRTTFYFNNPNESTRVIEVDEKEIYVNHLVAEKLSPSAAEFFNLNHEGQKGRIRVSTFQYAVYLAYFRFVLTENFVVEPDWIFELFTLANILGDSDLKARCVGYISRHTGANKQFIHRLYNSPQQRLHVSRYLEANLTESNISQTIDLAVTHGDHWLESRICDFIDQSFIDMWELVAEDKRDLLQRIGQLHFKSAEESFD